MDELAAVLAGSFSVSSIPNNPAAPHPRFSQYKSRTPTVNQEERRRRFLELQKQKRFDFTNYVRCLADDDWDGDGAQGAEDGHDADGEEMDIEDVHLLNPGRYYRNQLMLSEWMLDVPENFSTDWLMVPCPVGRRNLVIASNGRTRAYSKSGYLVNKFHSALPGGSRQSAHSRTDYTVLDCIYSEINNKYYVLDLMCWGQHPVYDSETEFRFFWLQTKMQEVPAVQEVSRSNPCQFEVLPNYECNHEVLERVMNNDMKLELDGLLFYHKRAHYTFGTTPLVVWLKAYMLPEILNVNVPHCLLALAPSTYSNFGAHAEKVRKEKEEESACSGSESSSRSSRGGYRRHRGRPRGVARECDDAASESMDSSVVDLSSEEVEPSLNDEGES